MQRLRALVRIGSLVHVGLGPVLIVLLVLSPPWVVGEGRVLEAMTSLETTDWRWWALVPLVLVWGLPILAVGAWLKARDAGLELVNMRQRVEDLLADRQLPIVVDVDTRVPVKVEAPLSIPIELETTLAFDEEVEIETKVSVNVELPLDTVVETSVFGLGSIKVPLKARIPVDVDIPIKGKIRIKTDALPVQIRDACVAHLPPFEVPLRSRFETKLSLLDNLRGARDALKEGVGEALAELDRKAE